MQSKPLLIAICGRPGSGKSALQEILHRNYGIVPRDDGDVIRKHCMRIGGLSEDDVFTQSGKKRFTEVNGMNWQNRKMLGEYGRMIEQMFGENIVADLAVREAHQDWERDKSIIGYSFGSVRRNQGVLYRKLGGIVIQVEKPGVPESGNDFDLYNTSCINYSILNDGTLKDLEGIVESSPLSYVLKQTRDAEAS